MDMQETNKSTVITQKDFDEAKKSDGVNDVINIWRTTTPEEETWEERKKRLHNFRCGRI